MKCLWATVATVGLLVCGNDNAQAANQDVTNALESRDDLALFQQAMIHAGVANELRPDVSYTLFVPTNAAFSEGAPYASSCYYSPNCRAQMAAVVRNHILPINERVSVLAKRGGDISTLGTRKLDVEEPFKGSYAVNGIPILNQSDGTKIKVYRINAIIADAPELGQFMTPPAVMSSATVTEKTTTYASRGAYPVVAPVTIVDAFQPVLPRDLPGTISDNATQTTTVSQTTTTQTLE